jgi:hypothetical protein
MHKSGLSRWVLRGVLVSAAVGAMACSRLPQQAGNASFRPGFARGPEMPLYNGTIADIPSSIDPRTPQTEGTPNRSLMMDRGQMAMLSPQLRGEGIGGSGMPAPLPSETAFTTVGTMGAVIAPSNQLPAAMTLPMSDNGPVGGRAGAFLKVY